MHSNGFCSFVSLSTGICCAIAACIAANASHAAPIAEPPAPLHIDSPQVESPVLPRPTRTDMPGPTELPKGMAAEPKLQPAPVTEPKIADEAADSTDDLDEDLDKLEKTALLATARSSRATKTRSAVASRVLGLVYLHGAGVPVDFVKAEAWFNRAMELGDRRAAAGLAWCALEGCADVPKPGNASRWIEQLQRVDRARALYLRWLTNDRLAPLSVARPGTPDSSDLPIHDREWLEQSARQGNVHAAIELGLLLVERGNTDEALRWFDLAAPRSNAAAENARLLRDRDAGLPPPRRVSKQPQMKDAPGQEIYEKALRFHRGVGVPANYTEAIRLYRSAESAGNPTAKRMLALIFARPLIGGMPDLDWMRQLAWADVSGAAPISTPMGYDQLLRRELTPLVDMLPKQWRQQLPLD